MKYLKNALHVLANPHESFRGIHAGNFEKILTDYLKLLITAAIMAGIFHILYALGNALYLDVFKNIDISYWRMLNYASGESTGMAFFFLFAGTFILFMVSLIVLSFIKIKYTALLKIMFIALTPPLLFSWLPVTIPGLAVWSVVLFVKGIEIEKSILRSEKGTIHERD
jgi:hypothetical protein